VGNGSGSVVGRKLGGTIATSRGAVFIQWTSQTTWLMYHPKSRALETWPSFKASKRA